MALNMKLYIKNIYTMGNTENLRSIEAIDKVKDLIEKANICLFTTNLNSTPLSSRPMSTLKVDENGIIWFFSKVDSDKNMHIKQDDRVQLFYSHSASSEYLTLFGRAEIITDQRIIHDLWNPLAKIWFDGKEDPTITVLKVTPEDGHYWDKKSNKMVQMLKLAIGAITGKPLDDGLEGNIRI
jgi:general stress protein 26